MLSKKVYITPSAFFAFIDRANPKHVQASAYFRYFAMQEYSLFTDSFSINEAYQQIYNDISPSLAKDFIRTIFLSDINLLYPEESDIKAAAKTVLHYQIVEFTFHKALMAVVAYRKNIPQIFTFDYFNTLFGLELFSLPI